ncbi:YhbD family protein [Thermoanaerobacterium thermosaccharolyticum]|uniref:YhbD family protein n=1 Tax=Thermoanaerobacterium thermosaccharolyticum TaxID=1517 RepID=UPI003D2AAF03
MDNNDLISKKELLEITGISYGQLYRWKRKNLIPEEWFIRKSTFTGQETFFPKAKILKRVNKILSMKEDLSLDDLANMLSPNTSEIALSLDEIKKRNIVSLTSLELYIRTFGEEKELSFDSILYIYIVDKMLVTGDINLEEGKIILESLKENYNKFGGKNCDLVFLRKFGVSTCFLVSSGSEVYFESGAKIIRRINIVEIIEELKIKLINGGESYEQ